MADVNVSGHLSSAQSSDHQNFKPDFQQLVDPYRRELLVHCYRILGSLDDAEDALQETLLRAWKRLDSLKAQTSLRAWLYKIGTNVSLDMLDSRKSRLLPDAAHKSADPREALPGPVLDPLWLDPLPDTYLDGHLENYVDGSMANPEAHYEAQESISLAFLTALQRLPGRQRAVLILRDVMGWKAQEVADLLNLSVAAANSALQRARVTMKKQYGTEPGSHKSSSDDAHIARLLSRYVQAWEAGDSASLVALLREDAILTMPPLAAWYRGRAAIKDFLDRHIMLANTPKGLRLLATHANGCPAFVVYQRDEAGQYRVAALQVLTVVRDEVARIDDFLALDDRQIKRFQILDVILSDLTD